MPCHNGGGATPRWWGGAQLRFLSKPLARLRDGPLSPQWRPQRPSLRPPPCSVRRCPGIALRPTARTTGHEPHTSRVTERGRLTFSRKDDYGRREEEPRRGTCSWSRRGAQGCIGSGKGTRSFVKAFYSSVFRGGGMKAEIKGGWAALSSRPLHTRPNVMHGPRRWRKAPRRLKARTRAWSWPSDLDDCHRPLWAPRLTAAACPVRTAHRRDLGAPHDGASRAAH